MLKTLPGIVVAVLLMLGCGSSSETSDKDTGGSPNKDVQADSSPDSTVSEDDQTGGKDASPSIGKWGIPWEGAWPKKEETAVFTAGNPNNMVDLPVRIEYDIEYEGGTWDRLIAGTPEPGNGGGIVIFDRSIPWEISLKAVIIYYKGSPDNYAFMETFDPPTKFPLNGTTGDVLTTTGYTKIIVPGVEDPFLLTQYYSIKVLDTKASIELDFGKVEDCLLLEVTVTDDLDQPPLVAQIYIHPELNVVYFEGAPGVALAKMKSPWK